MKNWLDTVEVGDTVIMNHAGVYSRRSINHIERLTKTQIVIAGFSMKFRRSDGHACGAHSYYNTYLVEATSDEIAAIRKKAECDLCLDRINTIKWSSFSNEFLTSVINLANEELKRNDPS